MKIDPTMFGDKTILQFMSHISPNADERREFGKILSGFSRDIPGLNWLATGSASGPTTARSTQAAGALHPARPGPDQQPRFR